MSIQNTENTIIELALKRILAKSEPTRKLFADIWNFIGRVEVAGVKLNTSKEFDKEMLFEEFSYSLADTLKSGAVLFTYDEKMTKLAKKMKVPLLML